MFRKSPSPLDFDSQSINVEIRSGMEPKSLCFYHVFMKCVGNSLT